MKLCVLRNAAFPVCGGGNQEITSKAQLCPDSNDTGMLGRTWAADAITWAAEAATWAADTATWKTSLSRLINTGQAQDCERLAMHIAG